MQLIYLFIRIYLLIVLFGHSSVYAADFSDIAETIHANELGWFDSYNTESSLIKYMLSVDNLHRRASSVEADAQKKESSFNLQSRKLTHGFAENSNREKKKSLSTYVHSTTFPSKNRGVKNVEIVTNTLGTKRQPLIDKSEKGCVGNLVWLDKNRDGLKQTSEFGMPGMVIDLINMDDEIVATEVSTNGYYKLCQTPGDYRVRIRIPEGFEVTAQAVGDDVYHDSDANSDGYIDVRILASRDVGKYDFGLVEKELVSESSMRVLDSQSAKKTKNTQSEGHTTLNGRDVINVDNHEMPRPEANSANIVHRKTANEENIGCVGNLVWHDDGNGIKEITEIGMPDLALSLLDQSGNKIDSDLTTKKGYFVLCGLPGVYTVSVKIPSGFFPSPRAVGLDKYHDSDLGVHGVAEVVIVAGRRNLSYDFGLVSEELNIDQVKTEENSDGIADTVEKEIGVEVDSLVDSKPLLGVWVESRHRNDGVFGRFNSALVWVTTANIEQVLADARKTRTKLILQLGSAEEWGWDFSTSTSTFTTSKWKASIDRFASDSKLKELIQSAIDDEIIRSIYLIDEPHHVRWSPNRDSNLYISNKDIDEMAGHILHSWPNASTSVRASPRTLVSYNRKRIDWKFLNEAFLMINYKKWAKHGFRRSIEGFIERELREASIQGLGVIGSVQMLIGAPIFDMKWWPGGLHPVGKLKVSPIELQTYVDAFFAPRNDSGVRIKNGNRIIDTVMIFRWDRNNESDWNDNNYGSVINSLIKQYK